MSMLIAETATDVYRWLFYFLLNNICDKIHNMNNQEKLVQNSIEGLEMYFSPKIASEFAELEQNEKNFRVVDIIDRVTGKIL